MRALTLVPFAEVRAPAAETANLMADYLVFDRQRTARRQYLKAFGGMAVLVMLGALFGRVAAGEAEVVAGLLLTPPAVLAAVELVQRYRLVQRLNRLRAQSRR